MHAALSAATGRPSHLSGFEGAVSGYRARGQRIAAKRTDSVDQRAWVDLARADSNGELFASFCRRHGITGGARNDAEGAGVFMARDLEHRYAEVLKEPLPPMTGFTLFPQDRSVPVGAKTHTMRRLRTSGEAMVHGGQGGVPKVSLSQVEQEANVRHYVDGFEYSLFDAQSAGFANFALVTEKLAAARLICMLFANEKIWKGDNANGIWGILNYPWLAKYVLATRFDGSATPDAVVTALNAFVAYPKDTSGATMAPNRLAVSPRIYTYLTSTPRASGTDTTIAEFFLKSNAVGITKIDVAPELQGAGPGGTDGMLAYNDGPLGVRNVIVQDFTPLPSEARGFVTETNCYMSHGGILMPDVGNNVLGWAEAVAE